MTPKVAVQSGPGPAELKLAEHYVCERKKGASSSANSDIFRPTHPHPFSLLTCFPLLDHQKRLQRFTELNLPSSNEKKLRRCSLHRVKSVVLTKGGGPRNLVQLKYIWGEGRGEGEVMLWD